MRWYAVALLVAGAGCSRHDAPLPHEAARRAPAGIMVTTRDTAWPSRFEAAGVAEPIERATLSTRLMGTVEAIHVREGARVRAGDVLIRLDQGDVRAASAQAEAALASARAMRDEAERTAVRMRNLHADSAAPRAQLDQAEAMLSRAEAGVRAADAGVIAARSASGYATIRAPFTGTVTIRHVDPGAFASPGAPLLTLENSSRLRIVATVPLDVLRDAAPGRPVPVRIAGIEHTATIEGSSREGGVYVVNAILPNPGGDIPPGSPATVLIEGPPTPALLVPEAALVHEGDLTAVWRRSARGPVFTLVRPGDARDGQVEVLSGLARGDSVVVPR